MDANSGLYSGTVGSRIIVGASCSIVGTTFGAGGGSVGGFGGAGVVGVGAGGGLVACVEVVAQPARGIASNKIKTIATDRHLVFTSTSCFSLSNVVDDYNKPFNHFQGGN